MNLRSTKTWLYMIDPPSPLPPLDPPSCFIVLQWAGLEHCTVTRLSVRCPKDTPEVFGLFFICGRSHSVNQNDVLQLPSLDFCFFNSKIGHKQLSQNNNNNSNNSTRCLEQLPDINSFLLTRQPLAFHAACCTSSGKSNFNLWLQSETQIQRRSGNPLHAYIEL